MVVVAVLGIGAIVFVFIFTSSSSNTGDIVLRPADSYAMGSVEFVAERNFFVVRLPRSGFLALADMDADNRASEGRRCRVGVVPGNDPALPGLLERHEANMGSEAVGTTLVFREACNGAVFDVTGQRISGEGPNLDRYAARVNDAGELVVNVSRRECSESAGRGLRTEVRCPVASPAGLQTGE
jgi:hypothetical protein